MVVHRVAGIILLGASLLIMEAPAQGQSRGRAKNFVAPATDAEGHKTVLRGEEARPAGQDRIEITGMRVENYRGEAKDMIAQAANCLYDARSKVAFSAGPVSIRTADERFSIEGRGFRWELGDSRQSSGLVISNRVHSLVRKGVVSGLRREGPPPASQARPVGQGAGNSTNDFVEVEASQFEYQADRAVYRGDVRVREAEGDLRSQKLTVIFGGDQGALQRIEAEQEVIINQGGTRITADKAIYTVEPENESIEFLGQAIWNDGLRQGSAERIVFQRRDRVLRAEDRAYLKLPRGSLGGTGFLSLQPAASPPAEDAKKPFIEVFSELMRIQLPPTNGPVQRIVAEKGVLIVDPGQDGRALADRAVYDEATGLLELSGSPILETEQRLVTGQTLKFDRATRRFTAGPEAYVRLPMRALSEAGIFSPAPGFGTNSLGATNQFVEVWSKQFEYDTNRLCFREDVRANFIEGDVARGKLTCGILTIKFGEAVESMVAEREVELEQWPLQSDPAHLSRTIVCGLLTAEFGRNGRLEVVKADQGVEFEQEESRPGRPGPVLTTMRSDFLTAQFSAVTNQIETIRAGKHVVVEQNGRMAKGESAVYRHENGLLELTGQATASMPEGRITEAERLIWDSINERFIGRGKFRSEWKRPPERAARAAVGSPGAE